MVLWSFMIKFRRVISSRFYNINSVLLHEFEDDDGDNTGSFKATTHNDDRGDNVS